LTLMQPLYHVGLIGGKSGTNTIFRIFRLARILRFLRLLRGFRDLQVIVKGALSGIRAALYVWVLLGLMLFVFSLIISASIQDEDLGQEYFSTVVDSMRTLLLSGIMLDSVGKLWIAMQNSGEVLALSMFGLFQFFSFFGLLNMLIGAFCNSAMQAADLEQKEHDLWYLKKHLTNILDCYIEDGELSIGKVEFDLIMKNKEVSSLLTQCGTDVDALRRIRDTLLPTSDSHISLAELFQVIIRLRAGTPAFASHIVSLTSVIEQRFDLLERHVLGTDVSKSTSSMFVGV